MRKGAADRVLPPPAGSDRVAPDAATDAPMKPFFVLIKSQLGRAYEVADALADAEIASEIYSIAGDHDLIAKFYVEDDADIGHFVNERVHRIPGILDTKTLITFKAF